MVSETIGEETTSETIFERDMEKVSEVGPQVSEAAFVDALRCSCYSTGAVFRDHLTRIRARIEDAARRSGRAPSAVTLIGVTKAVPVERIRDALARGLADVGENRVQEAQAKRAALDAPARWHLIGHLQRNKAKDAVELFDLIHSVDSPVLLEALERHAAARGRRVELLLQVNVSGEAAKHGCRPEDASALAEAAGACPHVVCRGLMTLAPFSTNPEEARPHFRRLRELRDHLQATVHSPLVLSMGMSQDFEVAIEEGADLVRIGTALFGDRGHGAGGEGKDT